MPAWSMGRTLKVSLKANTKTESRSVSESKNCQITTTYALIEVCSVDFLLFSWALIAGFCLKQTATALPFLTKIFSPVQTLVFLKLASDIAVLFMCISACLLIFCVTCLWISSAVFFFEGMHWLVARATGCRSRRAPKLWGLSIFFDRMSNV